MRTPLRATAATLGLALLGTLAVTNSATAAPTPPAPECRLVNAQLTATSTPHPTLNDRFSRHGNTSGQWVGGDSTYSVPLKDGTTAWIFSDTLYGKVTNNTLSPTDSFFLNNSVVLDDGRRLTTRTAGTAAKPESLVPQDADKGWYWFGAGTQMPNGKVQVAALRFQKHGPDIFDFGWTSNHIATFDSRTWKLLSLEPTPSGHEVQWGSWIQRANGHTLVYGVEDRGASKYSHVAKVLGNDLTKQQNWRYWTGQEWSKRETDSVRLLEGVSNEYSVTPYRDGYLMVTQDTREPFSNRVLGYRSCSPTGPFTNPIELYRTPETGAAGSYGDANIFTYNPHEHPQLRQGNTLVISYNVNSFDSNSLYRDVSIYRPRFVSVTLA